MLKSDIKLAGPPEFKLMGGDDFTSIHTPSLYNKNATTFGVIDLPPNLSL